MEDFNEIDDKYKVTLCKVNASVLAAAETLAEVILDVNGENAKQILQNTKVMDDFWKLVLANKYKIVEVKD